MTRIVKIVWTKNIIKTVWFVKIIFNAQENLWKL